MKRMDGGRAGARFTIRKVGTFELAMFLFLRPKRRRIRYSPLLRDDALSDSPNPDTTTAFTFHRVVQNSRTSADDVGANE